MQLFVKNLKKFKPNIIVGTGGFASGPLLRVAQWLGLPTIIQEQNSYPGITNRFLSKNAVSYTHLTLPTSDLV